MSPHWWWTCFEHASEWVPQYDVRLGRSCFSIYISPWSTELGLTTPKRLYSKKKCLATACASCVLSLTVYSLIFYSKTALTLKGSSD